MRKQISSGRLWIIAASFAAVVLVPHVALAADSIKTKLNGQVLALDPAPVIEHDRTLVPVRGFLEALGAKISWDQDSRTVTADLGNTEIKAVIGDKTATVNGKPVTLDVAPEIMDDHTLIPLRFFAENLGVSVSWDDATRTIAIDTTGAGSGKAAVATAAPTAPAATAPAAAAPADAQPTEASRSGVGFSRRAERAALLAKQEIGARYSWGGTSPDTGFDCSGLVQYIANQLGVEVPRTSEELFTAGIAVEKAHLIPGDLVFYTTYAPGASHVGVYVGDGKFVSAESSDTGVKTTDMANPWWADRYLGARRVFR